MHSRAPAQASSRLEAEIETPGNPPTGWHPKSALREPLTRRTPAAGEVRFNAARPSRIAGQTGPRAAAWR